MLSAVRASQALSSETSPQALLEHLLRVMVQASGAQRASLLVERDGGYHIEGHLDSEAGELRIASNGTAVEPAVVSETIVRYVLRTGEEVLLGDARRSGAFTRDPYVLRHASKSILCMAVRHRDRVSGVLFLENDLSSDAFTPNRMELLRLLVAQAAISFENARLFDSTQKLNLELRSSEALLRDFFDGMPVGVYVVDNQGKAVFANRRATEISGFEFESTATIWDLAQRYQLFVSGTDTPYPVAGGPLVRALQGESSMIDDAEIKNGERRIPIAAWGTPIRNADGQVRYALVAFQDISFQREAEAERVRLEAQLHQKERLESIGRLAGGVAHDFNNLLTPMLLYTEMARQNLPPGSPVHKQISEVHHAAERAAELTKQLLAFGRRQMLERKIVNLNDEIQRFGSIVRRLVREDIEIRMQLGTELDLVRADPSEMQRVLMNLALNAADAMPQGGCLTFETENVTWGERDNARSAGETPLSGACVVLRVSDTGHGMEQETLEKAFDPFFTTKPFGHGSGLGLPTVYGIVTQHGGRMAVRSAPDHGTTFEVFLPASREPSPDAKAPEEGPRASVLRGAGETILVVEDEDAVREVVRDVLERQGYRVASASNPAEAIVIAHDLGAKLDLLVSDIVMPGMNGRQLFAVLAAENPSLRALFISGYSDEVRQVRPDEAGPPLLRKPFTSKALGAKVRALLTKEKEKES
ncbi:MAG: ATP-binding protein [Myxococcales bacterium]